MATTEFGDPEVIEQVSITEFGDAATPILTPKVRLLPGQGLATGGRSQLEIDAINALPFRGAGEAFSQGLATGQDVLGEGLAGKALGTIFGGAMAAGTAFNPIGVGASYYNNLAQAVGESLAGQTGLAGQTLTGAAPVVPTFSPLATESTTANFITELLSQAGNEPLNTGLLAAGARDPATIAGLRSLPGSTADLGASIAQAIRTPAQTIASRGIFRQPIAAATTEALGITPIEGAGNIIPVVRSAIQEANAGRVPDAPPVTLLTEARDFKINQYVQGLELAETQGLRHPTQSLRDAMQARVARDHPTYNQAQIDAAINAVVREHPNLFSQDSVSPVVGQRAAVQINRDLNKTNPNRVPKTDAQLNAETALSQELSRQGSEMYQASTGTTATPNQDYGVLTQALEGIRGELKAAQSLDAGRTPGGTSIPTTPSGLASRAIRAVGGRALIPTNAENVSNSFRRVISTVEARPPAQPIDPNFQQGIINQYTPRAPNVPPPGPAAPTSIAAPAPPTVAPTLQQLIQARIQQMGPSFQSNPNAASIALRALQAEGIVP